MPVASNSVSVALLDQLPAVNTVSGSANPVTLVDTASVTTHVLHGGLDNDNVTLLFTGPPIITTLGAANIVTGTPTVKPEYGAGTLPIVTLRVNEPPSACVAPNETLMPLVHGCHTD